MAKTMIEGRAGWLFLQALGEYTGSGPCAGKTMPIIRIPRESWGRVWRILVASGPISRVSQEHIYCVSDEQVRLLRRKKLPFELLPPVNGRTADESNG